MKKLITISHVKEAHKRGDTIIYYDNETIITSLARDMAKEFGIVFKKNSAGASSPIVVESRQSTSQISTVIIGSDHGGFELKEILKKYISDLGYSVIDVGTNSTDSVDYPDFAYAVALGVSNGKADRGIMIDGAGVASCMVANKVPGIRASCCNDLFTAKNSREHNDANVLTLGGRVIGSELAKQITKLWLEQKFEGGRHQKRVDKIMEVEKKFMKEG
jgi:ribose 5-phosphate isomerase B